MNVRYLLQAIKNCEFYEEIKYKGKTPYKLPKIWAMLLLVK